MEKCQCSQCGSTDFTREQKDFLRCRYCHSLYTMVTPAKKQSGGGNVVIGKGATVVFGNKGKVTIGGELIIENGAHVSFLGQIDIVKRSSDEEIEKAKLVLQKKN
jgi:hypothetical protein